MVKNLMDTLHWGAPFETIHWNWMIKFHLIRLCKQNVQSQLLLRRMIEFQTFWLFRQRKFKLFPFSKKKSNSNVILSDNLSLVYGQFYALKSDSMSRLNDQSNIQNWCQSCVDHFRIDSIQTERIFSLPRWTTWTLLQLVLDSLEQIKGFEMTKRLYSFSLSFSVSIDIERLRSDWVH